MRAHGVLAVGAVFLLGWLAAEHIPAGWSRALRRASGLWLAGCTLILVVSGYALYYSTGGLARRRGRGARMAWNRSARRRAGALAARPRGALRARGARLAGLRGCRYHTRPFERAAACAGPLKNAR